MKNVKKLLLGLGVVTVLSSCTITLPVGATSNAVGSKVGESSGDCYLGFLCFGVDASIKSAAKKGNISKISTVDYQNTNILGLIVTHKTIVTGE